MGRGAKKRRSGVFSLSIPKESPRNTIRTEAGENGTLRYFDGLGQLHREDGPAEIYHGVEKYYWHGDLHREGGPALFNPHTGEEVWYKYGKMHREDGPAKIIPKETWRRIAHKHGTSYADATIEEYYIEGKLHREDGPAKIYYDGREEYWENGKKMHVYWPKP